MVTGNVSLTRKPIKHAYIRVRPPKEVLLSVPLSMRQHEIDALLRKKASWIQKHLERFTALTPLRPTLEEGSPVAYLGRYYPLELHMSATEGVVFDGHAVSLHLHDTNDAIARERLMTQWYRERANTLFSDLVARYRPLIGKPVRAMRIRSMTTRWGSCNHTKGYINLNLHLIKQPVAAIEYVVLHELAHLVHPNHGTHFYALIERHMPDWKMRKTMLRHYGDDT